MSLRARREIAPIAAAIAALAFIPIGLARLGFARDDWNHFVNMRDLHEQVPWWEAIRLIVTNEWFGAHELRIFFGAYLTDYAVAPTGALAPHLIYGIQLTMHVAAALMAGWIGWKVCRSQLLAVALALTLTYFPVATQPALWINNLFFVQPWFFLMVTCVCLLMPWRSPWLGAAITSLVGLACAFSGEATIALLLLALAVHAVHGMMRRSTRAQRASALLPLVVVVVSLALYLSVIVTRPTGRGLQIEALATMPSYLDGARVQFSSLIDPWSAQYGAGSVPLSTFAIGLIVAVAAAATLGLWTATTGSPSRRRVARLAGAAVLGLIAALVPIALGVVTGSRPGPDLRYLYVPAELIAALIVLVLYAGAQWIAPWRGVLFRILAIALVAYSIAVTLFNVVDIWGFQRGVDAEIWSRVDPLLSADTKVIVTFNPNHQYLMAPYHSNAVSDFQADWGVAARITWLHPDWSRVLVSRDATMVGETLWLRDYYGDGARCLPRDALADSGSVIYLAYDYGPRLADLASANLTVTTNIDAFVSARDEILARHPDVVAWTRPMTCERA